MQQVKVDESARVLRVDGVFDVSAAQRVLDVIEGAAAESEVYLDVTHVREFHDDGVGVLARALVSAKPHVWVRGLRQHQYRMLRYLGVAAGALGPGLSPVTPRATGA